MLKILSSSSSLVNCRSFWQHVHFVVEKTFADTLTSSVINSFSTISRDIVIIAFDIDSFVKSHHNYVSELSDEIKYTVNVIVIINFRSSIRFQTRIFKIASIEFSNFSSKWTLERSVFNNAIRQFHEITVDFRITVDYRSFLSKLTVKSSFKLEWVGLTRLASRKSRLELELESSSSPWHAKRLELESSLKSRRQDLTWAWLKLQASMSNLTWLVKNFSFMTYYITPRYF